MPARTRPTDRAPPGAGGARSALWTLALGYAPPLLVLAGVAAAAAGQAASEPAALAWAVAPASAAALLTVASAWRMLDALREVALGPQPGDEPSASQPGADGAADAADPRAEIDHRVRNTLQVVASLLSLELRRAGPSGEREALLRVQSRLHSLSLVYRRSSTPDAPASVRLDALVADIADQLFADRPPGVARVDSLGSLDAISVAPDRAVAFALFVNEALMNARDHLDRIHSDAPVSLSLRDFGGGACLLSIRSAGGVAPDREADGGWLGARLMANCAEQLNATVSTGRSGDAHEVRLAIPASPRA